MAETAEPLQMTAEQLGNLAEDWVTKLGLNSWTVGARFCDTSELSPDHEAEVEMLDEHLYARIRIMKPSEHGTDYFERPWDVERTLVHELLHLHERPLKVAMDAALDQLAPAAREAIWARYDMAREQMINAVARTLVNLKRTPKGGDSSGRRSAGPDGD